jgi:Helix-turn-helix of DDE superfamily endonuclease
VNEGDLVPNMGLEYSKIKQSEGVVRSLTGLTNAQFEKLLPAFEHQYSNRYSKYNLRGELRQRKQTQKASDTLAEPDEKLFFILVYLKSYPTQQVQASMFDMHQPQCNGWIKILLPVLNDALDELGLLPARSPEKAKRKLKEEKRVIIDATERPIQRPQNNDKQTEYYSGKKNGIQ